MDDRNLSTAEIRQVAKECYLDPVLFCRFFLHDLFPGPIPWFHRGLLAILTKKVDFLWKYGEVDKIVENFVWQDREGNEHHIFEVEAEGKLKMTLGRFTLIMMPRGSAKTTIAGNAVPIYETVYEEVPFGLYLSHAAPHAQSQLSTVKRELTDNDRLQSIWPGLRPGYRDDPKWSETHFETTTGIAWAARGKGGQVRGIKHRQHRPSKIIGDDLQDKESASSDAQRQKDLEWFIADVMPALPALDPSATIVLLGTMLNRFDLLNSLMEDPRWAVVKFGLRDRAGDPIWPEWMGEEEIEATKQGYAAIGKLHVFYMEYMNEPVSPDTQPFKSEYFVYEPVPEDMPCQSAIYCDPAISPKRTADKTAIVVVSMAQNGLIYVREVVAKRGMRESEKLDVFFDLHKKYDCRQAGVESTAYQVSLIHLMREEMFRRHHYFEITEVPHRTKKSNRIIGILQARYASGYIKHIRRFADLEMELYDYNPDIEDQPDDCADALAGAIALLDPYAAEAVGDVDLGKDEYEPLEAVFEGEWRSA